MGSYEIYVCWFWHGFCSWFDPSFSTIRKVSPQHSLELNIRILQLSLLQLWRRKATWTYIYIPIYIHIYCHSIYYHIFAYRFSCHGVGHSERSFKKNLGIDGGPCGNFPDRSILADQGVELGLPTSVSQQCRKAEQSHLSHLSHATLYEAKAPPKKNSNKVTAFCGRSETTEKSSQLLKPLESPIGFPFSLACRADTPCRAMDGALPHVHVNGKRCRLGLARAALDLAQLGGSSWGAHRSAAQNLATCTTRMAARGGGSEILTKGVLGILRVDVPMMQWLCIFLSAWCISSLSLYIFFIWFCM